MGSAWKMNNEGWRLLSRRFVYFFFVMAMINEAVWRTQSTDFWVNFKVFGAMTLTVLFIISQASMLSKHSVNDEKLNSK